MDTSPEDRSALSVAAAWAARVITVSMEMVVPGAFGLWLDQKMGTGFVLGIIGFALGMVLGIWHLLKMTSTPPGQSPDRRKFRKDG